MQPVLRVCKKHPSLATTSFPPPSPILSQSIFTGLGSIIVFSDAFIGQPQLGQDKALSLISLVQSSHLIKPFNYDYCCLKFISHKYIIIYISIIIMTVCLQRFRINSLRLIEQKNRMIFDNTLAAFFPKE